MTIPAIPLRAGSTTVEIPQLGFGVWQVSDDEATVAVAEALRVGYRHVDTARIYENETGTGRAVEESGIPRGEVFVTSKLWPSDYTREEALVAFDATMRRLGLEVLDLFLLHWPAPGRGQFVEAWKTLVELRADGRVRAVGVSNFTPAYLRRLAEETGEYPCINQIELHPYLQQRDLRAFHAEHDIVTEAWSPLASGKKVLADPAVGRVAAKHGVTPAQAILGWHLALGNVVIPKSVTPSRIAENFAAGAVRLDEEDIAAFDALDQGFRTGPDPDHFDG
ncbi:MAG: aldo/keto reductase [Tetrasphaera sp.]|jgi:2,5-diketo-D-gluconate reductase A|nr:aldo/keto reductase [Tetrasphaera sp.]